MMKKLFESVLILLFCCSFCVFAQEKEISVEDQYYEDIKKGENLPDNIVFAEKLQNYLMDDDIDGAIKLFDSIPASLKNDVDFKLILASLHISKKNYKIAEAIASDIVRENPNNTDAIEILAYIYKATNNTKKSSEMNKKLLEKDPYNPTANIIQAEEYLIKKNWKTIKLI